MAPESFLFDDEGLALAFPQGMHMPSFWAAVTGRINLPHFLQGTL